MMIFHSYVKLPEGISVNGGAPLRNREVGKHSPTGFSKQFTGGLEGIQVEINGMFGKIGDIFREYPLVI